MKIFHRALIVGLLPLILAAAETGQVGRIVTVKKNINTKTLYYVVNTPVTQDEVTYTIAVHLKDKIYLGVYTPGKSDPPPPDDWLKDRPVRAQLDGDTMILKSAAGQDFRIKIAKTKSADLMKALSAEEAASLEAPPSAPKEEKPAHSLVGVDKPESKPAAPSPPQTPVPPSPAPVSQAMGSVSVRTSPYLADLYVDGQDMGYTPAKVNLPTGKHTIRFEKAGYKTWTKDITVTEGSELLVDATLDRK